MERINVYLSAGWFTPNSKKALDYVEGALDSYSKFNVYSPRREQLETADIQDLQTRKKIFVDNVRAIDRSQLVVSSIVDRDTGTVWEDGYAYARGIPVIYTCFEGHEGFFNLMLSESGMACLTDKKRFERLIDRLNWDNLSTTKIRYHKKVE